MGLDGVHLVDCRTGSLERVPCSRNRCFRHMSKLCTGAAETVQLHPDIAVAAQFAGAPGIGDHDRGVAIGWMGLPTVGHRALGEYRRQIGQAFGCGEANPLVRLQLAGGFFECRVWHFEGQIHVTFLKCASVSQRVAVLLFAQENDLVLLLGGDLMLGSDVFGGLQH